MAWYDDTGIVFHDAGYAASDTLLFFLVVLTSARSLNLKWVCHENSNSPYLCIVSNSQGHQISVCKEDFE